MNCQHWRRRAERPVYRVRQGQAGDRSAGGSTGRDEGQLRIGQKGTEYGQRCADGCSRPTDRPNGTGPAGPVGSDRLARG